MRRNLTLLALAVAALVLAGAGAGLASPVTVSVSAVMDIENTLVLISNDNIAENFLTLPTKYRNLGVDNLKIENATSDNLRYRLKINGVWIAIDNLLVDGASITVTRQNLIDNGVADNVYENIYFGSDNNATLTLYLRGVDNSFDAATITYVESYVKEPEVKLLAVESWYTAKDRVRITNASSFPVENVDMSVTYPGFATSQDVTSYAISALSAGASSSRDLGYQKAGPYITTIHEPVAFDNKFSTDMKVYSHENLVNIIDFEFNPAVSPWDEYFPNFDFATLTVTVNGVSVTPKSAVLLEDFSLVAGPNTIAFTWTSVVPVPPPPPPVVPWWLVTYAGVPTWMWIVVCVFVVVILIALSPVIVKKMREDTR